jgi:hypothetical protein
MELCCVIDQAKCCVATLGAAYFDAYNVGENTQAQLYELLLLRAYIKTLCNYDEDPKALWPRKVKPFPKNLLANGNIPLSLTSECVEVPLDPDSVNCLCREDIRFITEQLNLVCASCLCNC